MEVFFQFSFIILTPKLYNFPPSNPGTSLITAANFCQDGKLAVVGTYDGRCIFYDTEVGLLFFLFFFSLIKTELQRN